MEDVSRRDAIRIGAAATVAVSVGAAESLVAQAAFFTKEELALVDELSEIIIPADEHSPGARAARVAAYLDRRLAEAWEDTARTAWRSGLALVERLSREMHGKTFLESSMSERGAVLTRMAQNEGKPQKPEEVFFAELKSKVVHAYYTSEIGIKQEMEYKGNTYQNEFSGFDVS
jgi:hypothetical protein